MDSNFHTVLLEGVVYRAENEGDLWVDQSGVRVSVENELEPLVGKEVLLALHHFPLTLDPTRWGGGSCLWESSGQCPAGHHETPGRLLSLSLQGILHHEGGRWWVEKAGTQNDLPFDLLLGHRSRIIGVSAFNPVLADVMPSGGLGDIRHLEDDIDRLQSFLGQFQQHVREV